MASAPKRNEAAWSFWEKIRGGGISLAPMVEMNDLAFRIQVRRHSISPCWTGMINANQWNTSKTYQRANLKSNELDRPLICQISGSTNSDLISAASSISDHCDAVDINLGCCQRVARRGSFGYYLVDTEEKRTNILKQIKLISSQLSVPLFTKIRILPDEGGEPSADITAAFAVELEKAGSSLITVHGRPASQDKSGPADPATIRAVVNAVGIPVIANGGIKTRKDAERMLSETGAAGVMVGQSLLINPTSFDNNLSSVEIAREYIQIFKEVGGEFEVARRHLFYFFDKELGTSSEYRGKLGQTHALEELEDFIRFIEELPAAQPSSAQK